LDNILFDKIIVEIENANFNEAIKHCDELLNEYPDNRSVYEIRSGCYYAIGDYDAAISDLTYSIVKAKGGEEIRDEVIGLYGKRGKIYLKKGEWLNATEDYKKILTLNPNIPEIQNSLALCYRKTEHYIEALYHSSQAIKLNNEYAEAYNNRANINISLEKYNEAIADYTRAIELNPLSANVYFNRGSIYFDLLKNKGNAIQDFLKAISINPNIKQELKNHYPELANIFDNKSEAEIEKIIAEEKAKEESIIPEVIIPKQEGAGLGFSVDDFDSLFKDKTDKKIDTISPITHEAYKSDDVKMPDFSSLLDEDDKKTEPLTSILNDVNKSDDIHMPDFSSLKNETGSHSDVKPVPLSSEDDKKNDDIIIPEFDLKSIFADTKENDDISQIQEEPSLPYKPVISDDVKSLHDEIQTDNVKKESSGKMGGVQFGNMSHFDNKEPVFHYEDGNSIPKRDEQKKSFLRSPIFFIIIIVLMAVIILLSVLKFFKSQDNQIVNKPVETIVDSNLVKKTDTLKEEIKDTLSQQESEKVTEKEPVTKTEEVKKEEVKKEEVLTTKNLGYLSDKKQFVLFSEPDGYYVQIGSYKEKSKAEDKLKILTQNNIKGKVSEVDLKEKGIFYRVRAGVFSSPEEAKEKTIKIE